ncbi:MAG: hypothetical protein FJ034_06000 [Chloroflexi bacterium]|nr:hypothetical protein [Chloroflexota bacterium]
MAGAFLAFTAVMALAGGIGVVSALVGDLPSPEDLARDPLAQSTKIYDRTGGELLYQFEEERREIVKFGDIPQLLVAATISAEDKSFWSNPGVDILGIARAALADVTGAETGQGGASTITQQLVKQRIVGNENSITRKLREAILAIEVTQTYSKQEILELYFNHIYYGNQAYGVKAAAQAYFGKTDLATLTLPEAALLAGLPQSPSILDPTRQENLDRAKARRAYVLDRMVEDGVATEQQARAAHEQAITTVGPPIAKIKAAHFVFQVRTQLAKILGGDESAVTRGGFKVTTTLDWNRQQIAERQVRDWVQSLHSRNVWNASLVSMDPRTGRVLAYVGSVDYQNRDDPRVQGQFDVAGLGMRQPGSAFKVFTYATALKKGATAATTVVDARTDFGGKATPGDWGKPDAQGRNPNCVYCPENADLQYHGPVTMRQAIRESRNVPAVKFLAEYAGVEDTIRTARELGITTPINADNVGLSLTLGAQVVRLIDMTNAFGTIANRGVHVGPTFITKVEDPRGRVVWEHQDYEQKRVLDEGIAWIMTDILKDTTNPGRSSIFGSWTAIGRPAALKTGTTDNYRDVYAVGYTPQLVTGVWMGNANSLPMSDRDFSSAMGPGQLWRDYMREALADQPVLDWERPASVLSAKVVSAPGAFGGYGSGNVVPSALSPFSSDEWFLRGTEPRRADDLYTQACGKVALRVLDQEAAWQKYADLWVKEANEGKQSYGRYTWSVIGSAGCVQPTATPAPTLPPGTTFPPGFNFPAVPSPTPRPAPVITPNPPPGSTPRPQ